MSGDPLIVIVDDDEQVRNSLAMLLRSVGYSIEVFENGKDLIESRILDNADCLILDVRLPYVSGLDFQKKLASNDVVVPIVFITGHGDISMSVSAMKAGAVDFLPKPFKEQDLLNAVTSAIERSRRQALSGIREQDIKLRYQTLSDRERDIMRMATDGLLNKQIAGALGLSEITVKIHRGRVNRKMMAKTFADLVRMAEALSRSNIALTGDL